MRMTDTPATPQMAPPTTLRLRQEQVRALDEIAQRTGRLRSEVLVEAVDYWLLLNTRKIDPKLLISALDQERPDQHAHMVAADQAVSSALKLIDQARSELLASLVGEIVTYWGDETGKTLTD